MGGSTLPKEINLSFRVMWFRLGRIYVLKDTTIPCPNKCAGREDIKISLCILRSLSLALGISGEEEERLHLFF